MLKSLASKMLATSFRKMPTEIVIPELMDFIGGVHIGFRQVQMNPRILGLVFAPFAFGTSAFVFIGLIDPMAEGLGVGIPVIGQLQMVFAIACGFGGPFLARLLSGVDRKRLLVGVLASMVAMNFASALAPDFATLAGLRFAGRLLCCPCDPVGDDTRRQHGA
jgi:MFS family permease